MQIAIYLAAALAEIAGCYAFWAVWRHQAAAWWLLPGIGSLLLFAFLLSLTDSAASGRTFAAYGGLYIAASLAWMIVVDKVQPDRWDLIGVGLSIIGALVIALRPGS